MAKPSPLPEVIPAKHKSFGRDRDFSIEKGYEQTRKLRGIYYDFFTGNGSEHATKKNVYIYSFPGAGKTHTGLEVAKHLRIDPIRFGGNTTMFAFAMRLIFEAKWNTSDIIPIWIDDCDRLLNGEDNLNTMKQMFDKYGEFKWDKGIPKGYTNGKEALQQAIESFEVPGIGLEIPPSVFKKFRFIVSSNHKLVTPTDLRTGKVKKSKQADGEAAIFSRVMPKDFVLSNEDNWGWLASLVLTMRHFESVSGNLYTLTAEQKYELLTWMHSNWESIADQSMRTVGDLAALMKSDPNGYLDAWEDSLV